MAATPIDALQPAIILLGTGVAAAFAARSLKISPIVGYLLAGVIIGPHLAGIMAESPTTRLLAELGVVFLLFDIGLHFSLAEVRESRRDMIGLAPAHMLLTGAGFVLLLRALGLDWPPALVLGASLGLSSTAVVSRLLADRQIGSCPVGRSAMTVLVFQDIVAIFLLILAGSLDGQEGSVPLLLALALGKSAIALAAALLAGRFLVRPAFRLLAASHNQEAFTAVALLLVLASAFATALAGLSLTLGAFLAGLALSDNPYRHQVMMEVQPFRGLLLSMFFINVGLAIDLPALIGALPLVLAATLILLAGKTLLGLLAARLNGWSLPGATQLGFLIGQGSEFTLVMASLAAVSGAVEPRLLSVIVAAVALSLAIAPFWNTAGLALSRRLVRAGRAAPDMPAPQGERPVLVYGLTPAGRLAIDALRHFERPYIALESDPQRFVAAISDGYHGAFGDAADLRLIDLVGASHARALVIGVPRFEISRDLTPIVRERYPDMTRFVSVETPEDVVRFRALGMEPHLSRTAPLGIELAAALLAGLGVEEADIAEWVATQRDRRETLAAGTSEITRAA